MHFSTRNELDQVVIAGGSDNAGVWGGVPSCRRQMGVRDPDAEAIFTFLFQTIGILNNILV